MLPPQHGAGVMQAGYQAPAAAGMTPQHLTVMLHDSLYPSQREWAAEKLSGLAWKQNEAVVQALIQGVREDHGADGAGDVPPLAGEDEGR